MARLLKRNPGSRHYRENATYDLRRGYYYRDAAGRWRTPDGRIAKGQRLRPDGTYHLDRAVRYNRNRHDLLTAIDATNALRERGFDVRLADVKRERRQSVNLEDFRTGLEEDTGADLSDIDLDREPWGDTP